MSKTDLLCLLCQSGREIEKFIIRQPPIGENDDYDSENSWISDGLPSSSRWEVGGGSVEREVSASEIDVDVDGIKSQIKVVRSCDPG